MLAGCALQPRPVAGPNAGLPPIPAAPIASELNKVALPTYRIEPPDTLEIDVLKLVPRSPYRIAPLDFVSINVPNDKTYQGQPITGTYGVEPGGTVSLGAAYGRISIAGMTLEEASEAINRQLGRILISPQVSVTLARSDSLEPIQGQHRVGPDGTINLGMYGTVYVTGATVEEARAAIEAKLTQYLDKPQVSVDIYNYASKVYYVIGQGAGTGDTLTRLQITGNETVLDAISQVNGLRQVSSKRIWIARPTPGCCDQILPVSWTDITKGAATATNYQIMPGDRIYIAEDKLIALDSFISKVASPIQRLFGIGSLGSLSVVQIQHPALAAAANAGR